MLLTMAFRNGMLEGPRFVTEKDTDISVRDNKNKSAVLFAG